MIPLVIGDSLAEGMRPHLPLAWPVDARVGRPLAEGMRILRAHPRRRVVLLSLGTNDAPDPAGMRAAIRESLRGRDCVVWATIYRRGRGLDYTAVNRVMIRAHARHPHRLRLVGWATRAGALTLDGVHPGPAGYKLRAAMYRKQASACD